MKRRVLNLLICLVALGSVAHASHLHEQMPDPTKGHDHNHSQEEIGNAFTKLKSLEGTWETIGEDGKPTLITYKLVASGTALVEDAMGMVSVYAGDHGSILMTHYCSAGNQPRMRASSNLSGNVLEFKLVDVGNDRPGKGFISGARFEFINDNHIVQKWTWRENGNESVFEFDLVRK